MTHKDAMRAWNAVLHKLITLGGEGPAPEEAAKEFEKEDKKKLRASLKFIKYIIKNI